MRSDARLLLLGLASFAVAVLAAAALWSLQ